MSEFEVPNQLTPTKQSFHYSARPLRQWINQLDQLNESQYTRELYRGLKHANRIKLDNKIRLELLESLAPRIEHLLSYRQHSVLDNPQLQRHSQYQLQLNLLQELSFGYKHLLCEAHQARLRFGTKMLTLSAERVMSLVQQITLLSARHYQAVPRGLWKDLNTAYRITLEQGVEHSLNSPVGTSDREHSCQHAYLEAALLLMVQTSSLRHKEADALAAHLRQWVQECTIIVEPNKADSALLYFVDLSTDHVPQHQHAPLNTAEVRFPLWLDLAELCEQLRSQLKKTPELDQVKHSAQPLSPASLNNVINHWCNPQQRGSARGIRNEAIQIQVGLKDIYACLRYPGASEQQRDSGWRVVNYGSQGLGLSCQGLPRTALQVGELIAIHEPSTKRWRVGMVRWVQHSQEQTRCGVAMIPGTPMPVIAERNHGRGRYEFTRQECIYFAAKDPLESSLAVPVQCFRFGEKTQLKFSNGQQRTVRLVERLELGGLFSRYQVRADNNLSWIEREVQKRLPDPATGSSQSTGSNQGSVASR